MKLITINRCLNNSAKFYGLSAFGTIVAGILMLIIWISLSMPFGIMASMPGYIAGERIGVLWHRGKLQRLLYWYLPVSWLLGGKGLPPSYQRTYL